jgi:uncharacterized protein (DUF488 family)
LVLLVEKPVLIFEKGAKVLRILDHGFQLEHAKTLCMEFLKAYDQRKVLASMNKIKLSKFPKELESTLIQAWISKRNYRSYLLSKNSNVIRSDTRKV